MILPSVNPFALRDMAFSHGWIALPPWSWRSDPPALRRVEHFPSGRIVPVEITAADAAAPTVSFQVHLPVPLSAADREELERCLRWMLRLDEDLTEFHALFRTLPGCETPAARGEGRLLRSWDFWEDTLKTICTTNTTWSQTRSMVTRLVERYGARLPPMPECGLQSALECGGSPPLSPHLPHSAQPLAPMPECGLQSASSLPQQDPLAPKRTAVRTPASASTLPSTLQPDPSPARMANPIAFPGPERLAHATEADLRELGLGYRAFAVRRLAEQFAAGDLPRDAAEWAALPTAELRSRLLALRGIGPYAAANLLMLLGHYDHLAIDSWLRRAVRDAWFDGAPVTDREIEASFENFGPWRALVYWFHPALHPNRDAWRQSAF